MNIYKINDLSDKHVIEILSTSIHKEMFHNDALLKNYLYEFRTEPGNLFNILDKGRYKSGNYFVVTDDDDQFVASAGWNEYDKDTVLLLTRMLVNPTHRTSYVLGLKVLPLMIEETSEYKNIWMSVNEYNQGLYKWFVRKQQGKSTGLYSDWPKIYEQFEPIGQKEIYNTKQYVVQLKK